MSENNINPNLDFYKGKEIPQSEYKPFPFKFFDEPRVFIEPEVYETIQNHAKESVAVELCGVLIGKVNADTYGKFLHVIGSIRGEYSNNQGAQVQFTGETWDYIHEHREKLYKDYTIVGWYHTHPGFGIFLSGMDKFIQDNFFNAPFQVALVVDPRANKTGLFAWIEGKTKALKKCWVGDKEISLTIGPVGSEDFENISGSLMKQAEEPEENLTDDFKTVAKDIKDDLKTVATDIKSAALQTTGGTMGIVFALCMFVIGFLLSYSLTSRNLIESYSRTAQAETREIITAFATDFANYDDLSNILKMSKIMSNQIVELGNSSSVSISTSTLFLADKINKDLEIVLSRAGTRQQKIKEILVKSTEQTYNDWKRKDIMLDSMKNAVSESILIQIEPYIDSLFKTNGEMVEKARIREVKRLMEYIIELSPGLELTIMNKYPFLYQEEQNGLYENEESLSNNTDSQTSLINVNNETKLNSEAVLNKDVGSQTPNLDKEVNN